jgi:hypothetical protein
MKTFKELLKEGGNVVIGDREAERIDLKKISRDEVVPVIRQGLKIISDTFEKDYGFPIWDDELFKSNKYLSGSAFHFFDMAIPSSIFISKKPSVGDIDTQVDILIYPQIKEFLDKSEGKIFGPLTLIGHKVSSGQLISLWELQPFNTAIQIDLEFVDFANGKPTDWAQFSHSSAWVDVNKGIKGVAHKFLMQSLHADKKEPIIILTGKKRTPKETDKTKLAFSVQKGLRVRYIPHLVDGVQQVIDGKPVYDELESKDSVFITELKTIFTMFFDKEPSATELEDMNSFSGAVQLVKRLKSHAEAIEVYEDFFDRFFGKGAQKIVRGNNEKDLEEKFPGVAMMASELGLDINKYTPRITKYYQESK